MACGRAMYASKAGEKQATRPIFSAPHPIIRIGGYRTMQIPSLGPGHSGEHDRQGPLIQYPCRIIPPRPSLRTSARRSPSIMPPKKPEGHQAALLAPRPPTLYTDHMQGQSSFKLSIESPEQERATPTSMPRPDRADQTGPDQASEPGTRHPLHNPQICRSSKWPGLASSSSSWGAIQSWAISHDGFADGVPTGLRRSSRSRSPSH